MGDEGRRIVLLAVTAALGCSSTPEPADGSPPAALVFEGNHALSDGELREELAEDLREIEERGLGKSIVDDIAFEVERLYRTRGFHFVETEYDLSAGRAVVRVREGPRVLIDLLFTGNTAFPPADLAALLEARRAGFLGLGGQVYVAAEVANLRQKVEEAYFERGYPEARIEEPATRFAGDRTRATVEVAIEEGPQHVVDSIDLEGFDARDREEISRELAHLIGSAYVPRLGLEVKSKVEEHFSGRGHPDAEAEVTESRLPADGAGQEDAAANTDAAGKKDPGEKRVGRRFRVRVRPGPVVRVRRVLVSGQVETDPDYVKSRVLLREGERWDGNLARRSFRRLFHTGLFRTVDLRLAPPDPAAGTTPEDRDLLVEVVEGPSLEYFFEVGFGSYDLLRGKVGARERNLFGTGLIGRAELLGSFRGVQVTVGVTDPWFLRSEWTADLPVTFLYREEPSFTIEEARLGLRLSRPITETLTGGAAYRFSLSRIDEFEIVDVSREEPDLRLGALGPFLEHDTRNDMFQPSRGDRTRLFAEAGSPVLGGEISFFHAGISTSHFLGLMDGTVLAGTLQSEWIVPIEPTDLIPIQERLFGGGENGVRSFQQSELGPRDTNGEPLGGEVRNLISAELRQSIIGQLSLAVFADYGNVARRASKPLQGFRPGVGVGLRYALPIGPVRVDVGFNPRPLEDEDLFTVHFAVGMPY